MKTRFLPLLLLALWAGGRAVALEVIGWVPPYAVAACQTAVTADFGAYDAKDGLTRVGLQFWVPRADGTLKYADHEWYKPGDADVAWWRSWGQANGIKILLTVYNNTGSWDWNLARSAFATQRTTFVNALVAELDRLALDGIDLDLEGIGSLDADRAAFAQFVTELSAQVKARGKILTVDSFHYIWNAPNHSWWPDWLGKVDQIHSMGYDDLYEGGTGYHKYSFQRTAAVNAGYAPTQILMGFPAWVDSWGTTSGRGTTTLAHLGEVRYDLASPAGLAIWDLQLSAPSWRTSAVWQEIAALKAIGGGTGNRAPTANAQSVTTTQGTARAITLTGSDPDNDPLTFAIGTSPLNGTLSGTPPAVTYTPSAGYTGSDSFTFTVSDGQLTSTAATVSILVGAGSGPLPSGWSSADVGSVGIPGGAGYDSVTGAWTASGSGLGITGTADQFRYAWRSMSGDGEIQARLTGMSGGGSGGVAGVMIRSTTAAGSEHHFFGRRADGSMVWVRRNTAGRSTSLAVTGSSTLPVWVRLVRTGGTITAYRSGDGITWTKVNNAKITLPTNVTTGLAVSSGSNASLLNAGFSQVTVVP